MLYAEGLFMRKGTIILSCMFLFTVWNVSAEPSEIKYRICFDRESRDELKVKKKIIEIYDDLMEQVDESSRMEFLKNQTELFKIDQDTQVFLLNGTLNIVIKNGDGFV